MSPKPHAVLVAVPLQGHLTPAINLAFTLAAKGFVVTFVNAESKTQRIITNSSNTNNSNESQSTDIFAKARVNGLDIRYELVTDGVPESFHVFSYLEPISDLFVKYIPAHVENLLQRLVLENGDGCISCFVTDTFYIWSATMAEKFRIPFVSFWTEAATVFSLYYYHDLIINTGPFDLQENMQAITNVPGIPSIEPTELVSYLQEPDKSTPTHHRIFKAFNETKKAKFVLCNAVQELEPQCIDELQKQQPFFTIGPIMQNSFSRGIISSSLWPQSDCSKWLDMQPHASVLYISFGSLFKPNNRDLEEIMQGVLGSEARFLLVQEQKAENSGKVEGLLKVNEDKGMTVSWCSQKEVLKHPAVGGFLTHCGWNSILESIWCEVPMLCFPLSSDQFTNKKLVVKDWNIGLDIGPINDVSRDKVSEMIDSIICAGEVGVALRRKIKEVKEVMENAVSPSGSSTKNLDQFVEEIFKLDSKTCN